MSSDETDSEESSSGSKVVRRVQLAWLCEEVPNLWKRLEAFHIAKQAHSTHRGNKPIPRVFEAIRTNSSRDAIAKLPKNFYNNIWWVSLQDSEQLYLAPEEPKALPDEKQCVLHF